MPRFVPRKELQVTRFKVMRSVLMKLKADHSAFQIVGQNSALVSPIKDTERRSNPYQFIRIDFTKLEDFEKDYNLRRVERVFSCA